MNTPAANGQTVTHSDDGAVQTNVSDPITARQAVRALCLGADLPDHLVEVAERIAGELTAVSHRQTRSEVSFVVAPGPDGVTIRVHDTAGMLSPGRGEAPASTPLAGWRAVRQLSSSYGYFSDGHSRVLWAQVRA